MRKTIITCCIAVSIVAAPGCYENILQNRVSRLFFSKEPFIVTGMAVDILSEQRLSEIQLEIIRETFQIRDMVVVRISNDQHSDGVFNPASLRNIYDLTEFAMELHWDDPSGPKGVIALDVLAPSTVDRIGSGGPGVVIFEWLLKGRILQTKEAALSVRDAALDHPLLKGTVVSSDGRSVYIWLPTTDKEVHNRIQTALEQKIQEFDGFERYDMTEVLIGAICQNQFVGDEEATTDSVSGPSIAYLVLGSAKDQVVTKEYIDDLKTRLSERSLELKDDFPNVTAVTRELEGEILKKASGMTPKKKYLDELIAFTSNKVDTADEKDTDLWFELTDFFEIEAQRLKSFRRPEMLRYISDLQKHLQSTWLVAKSDSVADIVRKMYQELIDGKSEHFIIPDTSAAVAQCLLQFQSSHTPDDLWKFVTTNYEKANIRMQLNGSSTEDLKRLAEAIRSFLVENRPPVPLESAVLIPCLTRDVTNGMLSDE